MFAVNNKKWTGFPSIAIHYLRLIIFFLKQTLSIEPSPIQQRAHK